MQKNAKSIQLLNTVFTKSIHKKMLKNGRKMEFLLKYVNTSHVNNGCNRPIDMIQGDNDNDNNGDNTKW